MTINASDVIAWVETKNDPHGFRFEPAVYAGLTDPTPVQADILARIKALHKCSDGSSRVIYSCSFGAHQIMGFNLWGSLHCPLDFADFMKDTICQVQMFTELCVQKNLAVTAETLAESPAARVHFAERYNGALGYATLIAESLEHFGLHVTQ